MKAETNLQRFDEPETDGIDRRGFLKCMAWAGTGALCVIKGGVLNSYSLGRVASNGQSMNSRANSVSFRSAIAIWVSTKPRIRTWSAR